MTESWAWDWERGYINTTNSHFDYYSISWPSGHAFTGNFYLQALSKAGLNPTEEVYKESTLPARCGTFGPHALTT